MIDQKVQVECNQSGRDVTRCASVGPWPAADISVAISFHGAAHALLRLGVIFGRLKNRILMRFVLRRRGVILKTAILAI